MTFDVPENTGFFLSHKCNEVEFFAIETERMVAFKTDAVLEIQEVITFRAAINFHDFVLDGLLNF